jgi:hypothetical protein
MEVLVFLILSFSSNKKESVGRAERKLVVEEE